MTRYIFLHGFTGAPESWTTVREHLGPHHALTLALPGHGAPHRAGLDEAPSWEAALDGLAARIREAGFEGAHLVGYSMGARVALGLLVRHPGIASRATLIGVHPGLPEGPERWARAQWEAGHVARLDHNGLEAFVDYWEQLPVFQHQDPAQVADQRAIRLSHTADGLAHALSTLGLAAMPDLRGALPQVAVPVTLLVGERDARFQRLAAETASGLRDPQVHLLSGSGHNPLVECPAALAARLDPTPDPARARAAS